jgi:hypothetical protein
VRVRAFQAPAGGDLAWLGGWAELPAPPVQPANIPADGRAVVGPSQWVPAQAGPASLLVVVECAQDPALTETLPAGGTVPHSGLVPFDNHLAMRDIAVT